MSGRTKLIVFLTLLYCGVLAVLVELGVIKFNLWWKLSPLVWMLLLFVVLFIPMQWGAPVGTVTVYQGVVEIVPNVSGEVIDIPIDGLTPLKKGDVLFRIDPEPFQARVNELEAQLADTQQSVERLKAAAESAQATVKKTEADVDLAKAELLNANAAIQSAEAALGEARGLKEKATTVVKTLTLQFENAEAEYKRVTELLEKGVATKAELDRSEFQMKGFINQLETAKADERVADETIKRYEAEELTAEAGLNSTNLAIKQLVDAELPRVQALAREAELAANSMIGDEHTSVVRVRAQLQQAEYELEQTTVRAPSDGMVVGMTLRPGQRVENLPMRSWISFVPEEDSRVGIGIPQYTLRHVKPGQPVEVTMKLYPGKIFQATVDEIFPLNDQGQLPPNGIVPTSPDENVSAHPFAVRIRFEEESDFDPSSLPAGAIGTAAVYTDRSSFSHVIRKVMLRMEAWMNYLY